MKLSRKLVMPIMAILLAVGLATAGASSAQAGRPKLPGHAPLVCMLGGGTGNTIEWGCGWGLVGGGGQIGDNWGYDRSMFTDTRDLSPWQVIKDPRLFPGSDTGYTCVPGNYGSAVCTRFSDAAPKPGIDNATVAQLASGTNAATGSVLGFEERDDVVCATSHRNGCFKVIVDYPKYKADATYEYDNPGDMPYLTGVSWYRKDGKGPKGSGGYMGTSRTFLTGGPGDLTEAAPMLAADGISTTKASTPGGDVTYQLNVLAQKAGSAMVTLDATGFVATDNRSVPPGWIEEPAADSSQVVYLIPNMAAGDSATAWVHFTVTGAANDMIVADVNGAQTSQTLSVRPDAPTCTDAEGAYQGQAVVPVGGAVTQLDGVFCAGQSDSTLKVWTGDQRGAGTLSLTGSGNTSHGVSYQAPNAAFTGSDTLYVYVENSAGVASLPTPIHVDVAAPAVATADSYAVAAGASLTVDAAHGLMANDQFAAGTDGWSVQQGAPTHNGTLTTHQDGSFTYTPNAGFAGDDTFKYRLNGPHGQNSNVVTVIVHVTN